MAFSSLDALVKKYSAKDVDGPYAVRTLIGHMDFGYLFFQVSAVTQNRPVKVEIKGFKTSHSLEVKTALVGPITAGLEGHVECPESERLD